MAELPDWQSLDGVAPPIPESGGAGREVVLVASQRAVAEGWAPGVALDLVRRWSAAGHRLILVDAGLDAPSLHTAAGIPNREGLTDATHYGASVSRVARPIDGGGFLITAGTPIADPGSVVRSSRWHRFAAGMTEAGVTPVVYLHDGAQVTPAFLGSASDIVVLAQDGEASPSAVRDLEPLVRAVTGAGDGAGSSRAVAGAPEVSVMPSTAMASTGGNGRMIVFVVVAIAIAAVLGWLLSSGIG